MNERRVREIKESTSKHVGLCMVVYVLIVCAARCLMCVKEIPYDLGVGMPLIIAFVFSVIETIVVMLLWLRIALSNISGLQTFHTAVSAIRLLAILAILFVVFLIVGRAAMKPYALWMVAYFFVLLILHSSFFARINNRLYQ